MKQPCGCCTGIELVTPLPEWNRSGLPTIAYRVGNHATFVETMLARLSTLYLEVPASDGSNNLERIYPLKSLTTRESNDVSIALLDAWALVGDVLSFYQERIANEGYLTTATESRSVLELGRLVGYRLRPGVSASVYLAFTVADAFSGEIPAGTRAQSIPGANERPQFFETSDPLQARDVWNDLTIRLTRPQVITMPGTGAPIPIGADEVETIYFQGISTNLSAGGTIFIVLGSGPGQQFTRRIRAVDSQADENRTEVSLYVPFPPFASESITGEVDARLQPFVDDAAGIFSDVDLANEVSQILTQLISDVATAVSATAAAEMVAAVIPQIEERHAIAVKRKFTRLEPWLADLLRTLNALVQELPNIVNVEEPPPAGSGAALTSNLGIVASPLKNLFGIVSKLSAAPSLQPANSLRLTRSIASAFSRQSDIAPRILSKFYPSAAPTLYKAWAGIETPSIQLQVDAVRVTAGLFPGTYPGPTTITQQNNADGTTTTTPSNTAPSINTAWVKLTNLLNPLGTVALDAVYDKILPGSWIAIDRPVLHPKPKQSDRQTTFHLVVKTKVVAMSMTGYTARVTQLQVEPPWLSDLSSKNPGELRDDLADPDFLQGTVVYAQAEELVLAEEPLDRDVEGDTLELASLYDGLDAGRWIIVSGERTDIPNVTGVKASELVMISGVVQGSRAPLCLKSPAGVIPFSTVFYTTAANAAGDKLVVGSLSASAFAALKGQIPLPSVANQQFCDQVELGTGVYSSAYVPTLDEWNLKFKDFEGLLVDPITHQPYPGGVIPPADPPQEQVFAWRISNEPVHTILTLANKLSYTYDANTVTIYGNVVKATHGQTQGEVLGDGNATHSLQTFPLHQSPLTYLSAPSPSGSESTLVVRVNDVEWHEADNIAALGPNDRLFITTEDDDDVTTITFGTGERGTRAPSGTANIKATYRSGIGKPGNVRAEQISQMATQPLGVKGVINPLAASGGADKDSRDQARRNTPLAVMALDRLVSVRDYADFTRTYAGIGKASASRLSNGRQLVVHVTIAGADDIPIDVNSDLYRNLVQALLVSGDPHQAVQVALRRLKLLVIDAGIKVKVDYAWDFVAPNIRRALLDAYSFDGRDLGQSAFLSQAIAVVQAVAGVEYVDVRIFDSVPEGITAEQLAGLGGSLTVNEFVEAELAHMDPAATDPSQRILAAEIAYLTPDIADTLILTEITS